WVAAFVSYLAQHKPWASKEECPECDKAAATWKADIISEAIGGVASEVGHHMFRKLDLVLSQVDPRKSKIPGLLQRLHAVDWLFFHQGAGLQQKFAADELLDLYGLGVVLLTEVKHDSVAAALDPIGAQALEMLAGARHWAP